MSSRPTSYDDAPVPYGHRVSRDGGDLALEAWAPSRAECLAQAVRALVESFADPGDAVPRHAVPLVFEPRSDDDLLVDVLNEALNLAEDQRRVPVDIELHDGPDGLVWVYFALAPSAPVLGDLPAAVLPYCAELRQVGGGWRCRALVEV